MTKEQFIKEIAKYVQKYAPKYNIKVCSPIIAQACLESAYGTSKKAQFHNYFGLKYRANRVKCNSGYFEDGGSEQNANGTYTNLPSNTAWYAFSNMESGVEGYFQFINISTYSNLKGVIDPETYLKNIKADGYATSLNYVDNLMSVIKSNNLTQYDSNGGITNMTYKVAIDAGHGSNTGGKRHPDDYREHYSNTYMAFYLEQILLKNGIQTLKVSWNDSIATDDADVALSTRQTQIKSWGADISVSIHANAYGDGKSYNSANGVETLYHSTASYQKDSKALAEKIQAQLIKGTPQTNRGVKTQSLAMCNCVAMGTKASVLVETAFMTNKIESDLLKSDDFCRECAREIAQGIFDYLGVSGNVNVSLTPANLTNANGSYITASSSNTTYTKTQFIKDVQSAIGTKSDGIAGYEDLAKTPTVSKTKNNKHAVVKPLQNYLNTLGYNCGSVDGIAGTKFDTAVKAYQKAHGCVVDGEITAKANTWKSLLGLR